MTWFAMLLFLLLQVPPTVSVWPITVAGWATLAAVVVGPFAFAFGAGRVYAKLNGYGMRLTKVERTLAEHAGAMVEVRTVMQNIVGTQERLAELIGAATRGAQTCNDGTEVLGKRLADLIGALDRKVTGWERDTALELRELTTELRTRGHIGPAASGFAHQRRGDTEREAP